MVSCNNKKNEHVNKFSLSGRNEVLGDALCVMGGLTNATVFVTQEHMIKTSSVQEFLAMLGIFGLCLSSAQVWVLQYMYLSYCTRGIHLYALLIVFIAWLLKVSYFSLRDIYFCCMHFYSTCVPFQCGVCIILVY